MKRLLIGSVLASLAVFLWGWMFWNGPLTSAVYTEILDQDTVANDLLAQLRSTGVYFLPYDPHDWQDTMERQRRGPVATIHFRREGVEPQSPGILVRGFLHVLISVVILAFALRMAASALPRYADRMRFTALLALAAAVFANLDQPIWWHQTWGFHLVNAFYDFSAWLIAGLFLAAFIQPAEVREQKLESTGEPVAV